MNLSLGRHALRRAVTTIVLSAVASLSLALPNAGADPGPVAKPVPVLEEEVSFESGSVDWGFANRWRCYVVGLISRGQIEVSDGASKIPGSEANGAMCDAGPAGSEAIRFPVIGDYYDPATESLGIQTTGSVRFSGHAWHTPGDLTPQLDTTFSDIYITAEGDEGSLLADVTGSTMEDPEPFSYEDVSIVDLDLSGVTPSERADGIDWSEVPTALTEEGAEIFGSYPAGEPFDPLSISADFVAPEEEEPGPDPTPVKPGRIEGLGAVRAGRGTVKVARVFCSDGESPCGLIRPGRIAIRAGGKSASVRVKAPDKIGAGKKAEVKLVLGKGGKRLVKAEGRAKAKLRLTVTREGETLTQAVRVNIRR